MKHIVKSSVITLSLCLLVPQLGFPQTKSQKKPNVLLIIIDQLRRYSAGYWSESPYRKYVIGKPDPVLTPTFDNLAESGVVATRAISNYPLCSPARGMILSGMFPEQNGLTNNAKIGRKVSLKNDIPIMTDLFYKAGYNIAYFGKAHWLKPEPKFDKEGNWVGTEQWPGGHFINRYDTYIPPGRARHHIQYLYQSIKDDHGSPYIYSNDPKAVNGNRDGEVYKSHKFSSKRESKFIIKYLKNIHGQQNDNKPFLMIWGMNPPHPSWANKDTEMGVYHWLYGKSKYPNVDSLIVRGNAKVKVAKDYVRNYFSDVTSDDKYIGHVVNQLKQMGELDNTIIVITADHGEMLGSHGLRSKNVLYTEALAVPFIVHWPNGLKPGITTILMGSVDILPTIMGLAGMSDQIPEIVQGKNLSKSFLHANSIEGDVLISRSLLLLAQNQNIRGLLTERYELVIKGQNIKPGDKRVRANINAAYIFDNKKDPLQLHKIPLNKRPELAKRLLIELGKKLKYANDIWYRQRRYAKLIPYPNN